MIENLRKFIRKQEIEAQVLDVNRVIGDVTNLIEADAHPKAFPLTMARRRLAAVHATACSCNRFC